MLSQSHCELLMLCSFCGMAKRVLFGLGIILVLLDPSIGTGVKTVSDSLIVQTSYGPVEGYNFTSNWTNQIVYTFQGIPYAAPPVGFLRFKDPVAPVKWTSVKDCTKEPPSCFQSIYSKRDSMSEDCLFINVYTPNVKPEKALPVMVWVHGGDYKFGSGILYQSDLLLAEGVILVTLNYRLGAFGFLSLGTSEAPGNVGLKDQRLALKWVQSEISQFGGDAGNVTLFGAASGSACVHLHYLSPLSKGLFHRVIGSSGTALGWAVRENVTSYGLSLASALNCSAGNPSATLKCLLDASANDIVKAQETIKPTAHDSLDGLGLVFLPTVDNATTKEPFIPDLPTNMIRQKLGSFVPFMMGINAHDGLMMLFRVGGEDEINNIENNLVKFIPWEVRNTNSISIIKLLLERIQSFYFKEPTKRINGYIELYTDFLFGYHTAKSAKYFRQRSPVYLYLNEATYNISGVSDTVEMKKVFVKYNVNQTETEKSRELKSSKRMTRMWTNFAKFGTPTVGKDPLLQDVSWAPVGQMSTRYLCINDNLTMEPEDFLGSSVALWDDVSLQVPNTESYVTSSPNPTV